MGRSILAPCVRLARWMPIMMSTRTRAALSLLSLIALPASTAVAEFTGFGSARYVVAGELHTYHVVEVYATFDNPLDRILTVFNVAASLSNPVVSEPVPVFFQADSVDDEIPASFLPLGFLPPGEAWRYDTYVTIGAEQGDMFNGTLEDPSFVDAKFTSASAIGGGAGWYNMPPTNGYGTAGSDLKVLLGVFVVTEESFQAGLQLNFDATLGYARDGAVAFASQARDMRYPTGAATPYVVDRLDDDGNSDIVFYNPVSRQVAMWLMEGLGRKYGAVLPDAVPVGYTVAGLGDLDGNASTDIVWRDAQGRMQAWFTDGVEIVEEAPLSVGLPASNQCLGIGDLSGDGCGDLLFRSSSTGEVTGWLMQGFVRMSEGTIGNASGRVCEAIADFNGDGMQDILWRASSGVMSVWLMDGLQILEQSAVTNVAGAVASSWMVAGVADLSGDGKADIVWRHQTLGIVTGWLMDGTMRASGGVMHQGIALSWRIEAVRDVNNDGKSDLLWRNTANGDMNGWIMNGLSKTNGGFIRNAHTQWSVVVP